MINKLMLYIIFLFFVNVFFSSVDAQSPPNTSQKFLGNTDIGYSNDYGTFANYWGQITPDSSGKWGAIEQTRGNFDWTHIDQMYAYARTHNFPIKQHTFVWGIQEPSWIGGLSPSEQKITVENWIATYCRRYPDTQFIDVVNEPLPTHQPPSYKNSIGGDGTTGWDWIIWSYQKARQYCPNAKLLMNEYGTMRDPTWRTQFKQILQLLKDRNLIDGVGLQAYTEELSNTTPAGVKTALDEYWNMGIPIYISELSISNSSDTQQLAVYQQYFPVFWNHPGVFGVTLWGYREGHMYEPNAYLLYSNGAPRPALSWLLNYVSIHQPTPIATPTPTAIATPTPMPKQGDANGDGKVDETDYAIWLSHFGQTVSGGKTVGDFDTNGKVDGVDYTLWLTYYGT